jgi:hypothetical protein
MRKPVQPKNYRKSDADFNNVQDMIPENALPLPMGSSASINRMYIPENGAYILDS